MRSGIGVFDDLQKQLSWKKMLAPDAVDENRLSPTRKQFSELD
jgi:hypothetical protein